jgi:hypothetical protein
MATRDARTLPSAAMNVRAWWFGVFLAGCGGLDGTVGDGGATALDADALPSDGAPIKPASDEIVPVADGVASWLLPRPDLTGDRRTAFLMPWPSDLARTAGAKADLTFLPGAGGTSILAQYVTLFTDRLDGFSPVGAAYFRFGGTIDPATLPGNADASRRGDASVQLIDVDPMSPDHGRRIPIQWYFRPTPTRYWHANTLAVAPATGFPMRPHTRYALVVTDAVRAAGGARFTRDRDLDAVLSTEASNDPVIAAAKAAFNPALDELAGVGVAREHVLTFTAFTTLDPGAEFFRAADWLRREGPTPTSVDRTDVVASSNFYVFSGHYGPNPVFQAGAPPYGAMGSGRFILDAAGVPQVQRTESIHYALTIPEGPMPARGWPLAIYAHGTGGNYQTFISDQTAAAAAHEGVAMLGFDQVFHGERATMGTSPETAFFNFLNPEAGRANNLQAALDLIQCARFVPSLEVPMQRTNGERVTARFDTSHLMFFGHSQGGLNGPLWLAAEDGARTAVLSGAGGAFNVSLLLKTSPVNIPALITGILGLSAGELVPLHPAVTLLQLIVDPSDPVNYGRYIVREPRAGMHAKHVFQTQGFVDTYAPPEGIAALARSIAIPLVDPTPHPDPLFALTGVGSATLPAHNNIVLAGGGTVTGAWMQFDAPTGRDGHFVVFAVPGARLRAAAFLGSAGRDEAGVPTLPATVP